MIRFRFAIVFLLLVFLPSGRSLAAESKKKAPQKKTSSTITVDREQFTKMMEKLDALQKQVDTLKTELQQVKDSGGVKPPEPSPDTMPVEKPKEEKTDEEVLHELQQEMLKGEDSSKAPLSGPAPTQDGNPKISVVGDFVWQVNHDKKVDGGNPFSLREVELSFQDQVDPWTRADAFIGFHSGHVHVEEGYLSFHKLPGGVQGRVGKFLLPFGKDNQTHQHAKPYVDSPLCVKNFMGSENLAGTGAQLSYKVPLGNGCVDVSGAAVNDESSRVFSNGTSGKPLYLATIRAYQDLSESSNLELGYSRLQGFNDEAANRLSKLNGVDLTYRWKPLKTGLYNSLLLRGEYFWNKMALSDRNINSRGYYGFGQYQLNRNWYVGGRYDYSEFPGLVNSHEKAVSGIVTYFPTEFAYYRLQYKNTTRNYSKDLKELMFQINFMMGPHGAHKF